MKIKITVSTDKVGSAVSKVIEIDDYEFDQMPDHDLGVYIDECVSDEVHSMYYSDWELVT